ncbi:hypothetical protein, partial [Plasmodium yoelii yoelii]
QTITLNFINILIFCLLTILNVIYLYLKI